MKWIASILILLILQQILFAEKQFVTSSDSLLIDQQLDSHFGVDYEISDYLYVDSLEYKSDYRRRIIDDEYGTLNYCIVFTAEIKINSYRHENVKCVVGVYKANQIIWYSDFIIPDDEIYGGGLIVSIEDLNNDGKTEILTVWSSKGGASYGNKTLFVHSWDGIQGGLAVDVSRGSSPIFCHEYKTFDYIDIQGDGVFEIITYIGSVGYYPIVYEWDGTNYSYSAIDLETIEMFFPRSNFTPIVSSAVNEIDDKFIITYAVQNSDNSEQSIDIFHVYGGVDSALNITRPKGWKGESRRTSVLWGESIRSLGFTRKYKIKPGQTLGGFSYETDGLPIIANAYLRGHNRQWLGDYRENTRVKDYLNNSVILKTIAAKLPPNPFIPSEFLDTLIHYTTQSYSLGWIKAEQTKTKYENYFLEAKDALVNGDTSSARSYLKNVLTDFNVDSSSTLSSEAYALLRYNTEYLLEQLRK